MVCQLPPTEPTISTHPHEPWTPNPPTRLPSRYLPYEAFILACPSSPNYIRDTVFPAATLRKRSPPSVTLRIDHDPGSSPRQFHCLVYGWRWMVFDTLTGSLEDQYRLALNIPSAPNYDPSRNEYGVPWTDEMRKKMFGKRWMYRGWRGNLVHKCQDIKKKWTDKAKSTFGEKVDEDEPELWWAENGHCMANFKVDDIFFEDWRRWRTRTGRVWKSVYIPCPCVDCKYLRRREAHGYYGRVPKYTYAYHRR
ncbi:hypothetical protein TWF481_002426 [Arthrobotrys musiformis]|uniref:Uncharacterized protein n=1 Tax=Arthrobotrys musiformis TaxID=47236 RepID=A0AAV9VV17_9PEZI